MEFSQGRTSLQPYFCLRLVEGGRLTFSFQNPLIGQKTALHGRTTRAHEVIYLHVLLYGHIGDISE